MRTRVPVRCRESHCVRVRHEKNTCTLCADACPHDAISFSPGPVIDESACTWCTTCVAACRTAALESPTVLFWETVRTLVAADGPVLGCELVEGVESHATLPCVGYLAPEYLVALAVFMPDGVTLNMTACAECQNGSVAEEVAAAVERMRARLPEHFADGVKVARTAEELGYESPETDRRGFFSAIGDMVRTQTMTVLAESKDTDVGKTPFWEKIVPRERLVFERVITALREDEDTEGLEAVCALLGYTPKIDDSCQLCFGCAGMCPNGALDSVEHGGGPMDDSEYVEELHFLAVRCRACRVCETFCMSGSIVIEEGCAPDDVREWRCIAGTPETDGT